MCRTFFRLILAVAVLLPVNIWTGELVIDRTDESQIHRDLILTLRIVEEAWNAMDQVVPTVWPGWKSYKDELVFFGSPETGDMMINFKGKAPSRFKTIDRFVHGYPVFHSHKSYVKKNRGGGTLILAGKRYKCVRVGVKTEEADTGHENYYKNLTGLVPLPDYLQRINQSLEWGMGVVVHESFHMFQYKTNKPRMVNILGSVDPYFDPDQAAMICLEAAILEKSLNAASDEQRKGLIRQFLATRHERRKNLDSSNVKMEQRDEWVEGTAQYVETKLLMLLDEIDYKPHVLVPGEKNFFNFDLKNDLQKALSAQLKGSARYLADTQQRAYYFGMAQCFLLDLLCGNSWKSSYFEDDVFLEGLLAEAVAFDKNQARILVKTAKEAFNFAEMRADMQERIRVFKK